MSEGEAQPKGESHSEGDAESPASTGELPTGETPSSATSPGSEAPPPQENPWVLPPYQPFDPELDMSPAEPPLEPLTPVRPMASRIAEAADGMYTGVVRPAMPSELLAPQQPTEEEETTAPVFRPFRGQVPTTVCPYNLAGMCIMCPSLPCKFLKGMVLRSLLTDVMYGEAEE